MRFLIHCLPVFFCLFTVLSLHAAEVQYKLLRDWSSNKPLAYSAIKGDTRKVVIPTRFRAERNEMRGVWVSTYSNLDFPRNDTPYAFRKTYRDMVRKIRSAGFNAVFFQIRPSSDAFYPSAIHPYSRFIRGRESSGFEGMDMLQFMIEEARRNGLEFHAWLNPYRIVGVTPLSKEKYLATLSARNFARMNPECVLSVPVQGGNTLLLDPGNPLVRLHLIRTVQEIVRKYTPDSIVFDDYFYPYGYDGKQDSGSYRKYCRNPRKQSIHAWRRENVNMLIRDTARMIRENNRTYRKKIRFGVSPFGIWANSKNAKGGSPTLGMESYYANYCDTVQWIRQGYVDYLIPQLYWDFDHPKAPYACLADWWSDQLSGSRVKLYIGLAVYREMKVVKSSELLHKLLYNQRRSEIGGEVFFSWRWFLQGNDRIRRQALEQVVKGCWNGVLP